MYVVIFRATVRNSDDEYSKVATRMRELALGQFGCLDFHALTEGNEEVALSYWQNEESIAKWKSHPEDILAQQMGRERWYESYSVQVAHITHEYYSARTEMDANA